MRRSRGISRATHREGSEGPELRHQAPNFKAPSCGSGCAPEYRDDGDGEPHAHQSRGRAHVSPDAHGIGGKEHELRHDGDQHGGPEKVFTCSPSPDSTRHASLAAATRACGRSRGLAPPRASPPFRARVHGYRCGVSVVKIWTASRSRRAASSRASRITLKGGQP